MTTTQTNATTEYLHPITKQRLFIHYIMPTKQPTFVAVPVEGRTYRTKPLPQPQRHTPEELLAPSRFQSITRDTGPTVLDTSPIERAWSAGEPALSFSYRQPTQHWSDITTGPDAQVHATHGDTFVAQSNIRGKKGQCLHPACQRVIAAIADSQDMPKDPSREIAPYRTYDGKRGDAPSEWVVARRAGVRTLSLDMPMGNTDGVTITLADQIENTPTSIGLDIEYTQQDPETVNQIEWEKSAHYSGPTTYFRRKLNRDTGSDFVAIDRWGDRTNPLYARTWYARTFKPEPEGQKPVTISKRDIRSTDFEVAMIFEVQRPIHYPTVRDAYIDRVIALTGDFPTYEEQRRRAREGAQERLMRQAAPVRVPIAAQLDRDPFRFRFRDDDMHEPHESVDVSELVTPGMALRAFGKPLDRLYSEELTEIEDQIVAILRRRKFLDRYTRRHMRNHDDWGTATAARLHTNGAEYLASADDTIESLVTSAFAGHVRDLISA